MLTAEDDAMRELDIPERMQIASTGLPAPTLTEDGVIAPYIALEDIPLAVIWIATRISTRCTESFLIGGEDDKVPYQLEFYAAIKRVLLAITTEFKEVPVILAQHKDYLVAYQETENGKYGLQIQLLLESEVWAISSLSVKYRAFAHRKAELRATFQSCSLEEEYFEEVFSNANTVEEVADVNEWLAIRYSSRLQLAKDNRAADADEAPLRLKRAVRQTPYEDAKACAVAEFASVSHVARLYSQLLTRSLQSIAITASALGQDYENGRSYRERKEPSLAPLASANEYVIERSRYSSPEIVLEGASIQLLVEFSRADNRCSCQDDSHPRDLARSTDAQDYSNLLCSQCRRFCQAYRIGPIENQRHAPCERSSFISTTLTNIPLTKVNDSASNTSSTNPSPNSQIHSNFLKFSPLRPRHSSQAPSTSLHRIVTRFWTISRPSTTLI